MRIVAPTAPKTPKKGRQKDATRCHETPNRCPSRVSSKPPTNSNQLHKMTPKTYHGVTRTNIFMAREPHQRAKNGVELPADLKRQTDLSAL